MYHSVPGVWCRQWCNASRSCPPEQRLLSLAPPLPSKDKPAPSFCPHLCTSTPCPLQAGPGSCGWLTAGLWSSSPDWPGSPRQTCTSAAPARSTPARRRSSPRTRTAGRCSPPEQSLRPDPGRSAGLCRRGGSPSARTSASDRKSWSHPVCVCVTVVFYWLLYKRLVYSISYITDLRKQATQWEVKCHRDFESWT